MCNPFSFYKLCTVRNPEYQWASIVRNNVIGAVVSVRKGSNLQIISLAVKATYRNYGVGSSLLQKLKEKSQKNNLKEIHLHVQESNVDAIRFYEREGFVEQERITNFYSRLECKTAIHMVYKV